MLDIIIWIALTMSIGTGVLAVWVFSHLVAGHTIGGDSYNLMELWASIAILAFVLIAWCGFIIKKLRGRVKS